MNNTDPTSFQSILAGVQKLRDQNTIETTEYSSRVVSNDPTKEPKEIQLAGDKNKGTIINAITRDTNYVQDKPQEESSLKRPFQGTTSGKAVLVNTTQKENPLLNHLKNTNWRYISSAGGNKIYYDYLVKQRSVLFLTLTYHKLYSDYITRRMVPLSKNGNNILIFVVDDSNSEDILREITKFCIFNGFTLLLAFSFEQAAKYIEYLNK